MTVGQAAVLIAVVLLITWVFSGPCLAAVSFGDAYGSFLDSKKTIDGDPATYAETVKEPYRGEFFMIATYPQISLVRNVKIRWSGDEPRDFVVEMGMDAMNWAPLTIGEKARYIRVRIPAKKGDMFRIAEIESNSEVSAADPFGVKRLDIVNVETTSATVIAAFTKPVQLTLSYGLNPEALDNSSEIVSYMSSYQIPLNDLKEGLDYYVRIKAITADGEVFVSDVDSGANLHFRLLGIPPLNILSQGVGYLEPMAFSVAITTNIPSHCVFYFGEGDRFTDINSSPGFETSHVRHFKNLRPNGIYSYMAFLTDFRGMNSVIERTRVSTAEINVAKGKRVIAGTFTQLREPGFQGGGHNVGDTVLQRLTDGRNGYFGGMAHSQDLTRADQYAVIDLGRVYTLEGHTLEWRKLAFAKYYEMHASEDNRKWKKVFTMTPPRFSASSRDVRSDDGDPLTVIGGPFEGEVHARYVKLLIPKGSEYYHKHKSWNNVDLAEIRIYPGGDYDEIKKIVQEEWRP